LDEAQALFEAFDANLNGELDREEVQSLLQALGMDSERMPSVLVSGLQVQ
jgi:Ca2+-binding EF-hand superfamily protein